MPKVFLSYRRGETTASAGRLYDKLALTFGKEQLFFDVDTIDPGADFVAVIEEKVGSCDVLVALIGKDWRVERLSDPHDFVRLEIATALSRNIRVIPVLVDGAPIPLAKDLPEPLVPLLRRQALDLSNIHFHRDAERLVRAIEKAAEAPVRPAAVPKPEPATKCKVAAEVAVEQNGLGARVRNLDLEPVRNVELLLVGLDRYVERVGDFTRNPFEAARLCSDALIPGDDAGDGFGFAVYYDNRSQLVFSIPREPRPVLKDAGTWRVQVSVLVAGTEADRREFFLRWAPGETVRLVGDPRREPRPAEPVEPARPPVAPAPSKREERRANRVTLVAVGASLVALLGLYAVYPKRSSTEPRVKPAAATAAPSAKEPFVHSVDGQTYVWISPGRFSMGCSPGDTECYDDEKPAHEVEITRGFWIGQTEVTQAAWRKVMKTEPSHFKGDSLPVESITWDEARDYCAKIGGRLPTEAEWEFAARAGTEKARYGELNSVAWHGSNSGGQSKPVGRKDPNAWGLYDMLGNVWEWTADWYDDKYYQQKVARDPQGAASGDKRILRGGSWVNNPRYSRASIRVRAGPSYRDDNIGVRCAGEFR